jgi:hypothetical protein
LLCVLQFCSFSPHSKFSLRSKTETHKNCYISILPKELIKEVCNSQPVTYSAIRKRLTRKKQTLRIKEQRSYFATFLRNHRILTEYVDLLQGRIPKSVFARNYLKVGDLKELVKTVIDAPHQSWKNLCFRRSLFLFLVGSNCLVQNFIKKSRRNKKWGELLSILV